jgi:hypothetical protein
MLILTLTILGSVFLLVAVSILSIQQYKLHRGVLVVEEGYNGPAQVSVTLHAIIRVLLRRSVYVRKFLAQYMFHLMVRCMYYIDIWSSKLYAKTRNWFVQNAVRNRGTVPHFWQHLKVYKQEMDQEKEEEQKA